MTRYATLVTAGLMLLALGQACGTEFTACSEGEPCKVVATATGGSGGTGGSAGIGAGGSIGGGAAGASGGTLVVTSSSGGVAGDAGAPGAAGAPDTTTSGGTGGTGTGGTGGTPPIPCDGDCGGATPVCNEETDTCVACLESEDCEEGVCDTDANFCVDCLEAEDCEAPTPLCDEEQQLCVECLNNTDCTDTQTSFCDAGNCTPCRTNTDCAHLSGTSVCETNAGQCVQCTPENETVCGGTSCNPATNTCTTTELGTVDDCQPCLADSECIGNDQTEPLRRCVPMRFNGEPRDKAYCLVRRSQVTECARPYTDGITARSLSGAPSELYCGIAQDYVTCEAVSDLLRGRTCPGGQDSECGCPRDGAGNCTAPGQGALCRNLPAADNQCTYSCGVVSQCPTSLSCTNQDPDFCQ